MSHNNNYPYQYNNNGGYSDINKSHSGNPPKPSQQQSNGSNNYQFNFQNNSAGITASYNGQPKPQNYQEQVNKPQSNVINKQGGLLMQQQPQNNYQQPQNNYQQPQQSPQKQQYQQQQLEQPYSNQSNQIASQQSNSISQSMTASKVYLPDQNSVQCAQGCLFGVFLGDTMGSFLEFKKKDQINEASVNQAYTLPGGGIYKLQSGQLTDDGELTIMLAEGLLKSDGIDADLSQPFILEKYHFWCNSQPFDFGMTMQESWNPLLFKQWKDLVNQNDHDPQNIVKMIVANVKKVSGESQSNGFLMKQAPLGIYLWNQSKEVIFEFAEKDTLLTHSNQYCIDVSKLYVYAIAQLIKRGRKDQFKIYAEIRSFAWKEKGFSQQTKENFIHVEKLFDGITEESLTQGKKPQCQAKQMPNFNEDKIGWVKIAFSYCLYVLLDESIPFEKIFKGILLAGGDTDTNLCIVGGLVGALRGIDSFPTQLISILRNCDPSQSQQQKRDKWYAPGRYKDLSERLYYAGKKSIQSVSVMHKSFYANKIGFSTYSNQKIENLQDQEIDIVENCTIDRILNCKIKTIRNCYIKTFKQSKAALIHQSRIGEMEGGQIEQLAQSVISDTEIAVDKKNNIIKKKSDIKFGIMIS